MWIVLGIGCQNKKQPKWPYSQEEETRRREEIISKCFSVWDGSHIELTRIIKESMNDPDSYKHIQTTYTDIGNNINIKMSFRGRNAFGGVVKQTVYAVTDLNCNIIEIDEL